LEERDRQELDARAEKLNTTVSDLVEKYVLAGLREEDAKTSIVAILKEFQDEIRETRRDHALMAAVLLAEAGKRTREEGLKWAAQNIRPD
jgi:hypothetical protein